METTKEKFEQFINSYPRKLDKHVVSMCEPPLLTYNDYSLGVFPDSVVAEVILREELGDENLYFTK